MRLSPPSFRHYPLYLLPPTAIKTKYFRIGHMGVTVTDKSRGDIDTILKALKESLAECGYDFETKSKRAA